MAQSVGSPLLVGRQLRQLRLPGEPVPQELPLDAVVLLVAGAPCTTASAPPRASRSPWPAPRGCRAFFTSVLRTPGCRYCFFPRPRPAPFGGRPGARPARTLAAGFVGSPPPSSDRSRPRRSRPPAAASGSPTIRSELEPPPAAGDASSAEDSDCTTDTSSGTASASGARCVGLEASWFPLI